MSGTVAERLAEGVHVKCECCGIEVNTRVSSYVWLGWGRRGRQAHGVQRTESHVLCEPCWREQEWKFRTVLKGAGIWNTTDRSTGPA